jgi:hypothetical protein
LHCACFFRYFFALFSFIFVVLCSWCFTFNACTCSVVLAMLHFLCLHSWCVLSVLHLWCLHSQCVLAMLHLWCLHSRCVLIVLHLQHMCLTFDRYLIFYIFFFKHLFFKSFHCLLLTFFLLCRCFHS